MNRLQMCPPCLLWLLLLVVSVPVMAQTCRSESETPSTTPTRDFTDHGDGTVTHHATGLMWMKCSLGQSSADCSSGTPATYGWADALQAADATIIAGYSDWRLPNKNELLSILEYRCYAPAINASVFPGTDSSWPSWYWSASPKASSLNRAWIVFFYGGGAGFVSQDEDDKYVRLVRSIQ